jgi:hypothetical protein
MSMVRKTESGNPQPFSVRLILNTLVFSILYFGANSVISAEAPSFTGLPVWMSALLALILLVVTSLLVFRKSANIAKALPPLFVVLFLLFEVPIFFSLRTGDIEWSVFHTGVVIGAIVYGVCLLASAVFTLQVDVRRELLGRKASRPGRDA